MVVARMIPVDEMDSRRREGNAAAAAVAVDAVIEEFDCIATVVENKNNRLGERRGIAAVVADLKSVICSVVPLLMERGCAVIAISKQT